MRNKAKRLIGIAAAAMLLGTTFAFAGCGNESYKGDPLTPGYASEAEVASNGGFAVEKGDYVYFINGSEAYTASNKYGDVVKGGLMRISKAQLAAGDYEQAQMVVPSLFAAQNFSAGIFIYGDYVYYATPTTDKNLKGEVENSWIDFKRAKIDGTEAPMDGYYFRLSSNSANYRFVEEDGVVYCLYEEDGNLKSFNTVTKKHVTLVMGASAFYYDKKDLTNPNVYYTMSVTYNIDSDEALEAQYNQLYCVNAAATVTVNADKASYTVTGGKTYDFDEAWMKAKNKEAKKDDKDEPYDLGDYTTYPYVNLGDLVLDGVGSKSDDSALFNSHDKKDAMEWHGYTYTVTRYENGGVYFTRTAVNSDITDTKLYYLADANIAAETWNTVTANNFAAVDTVAKDTTNASDTALFEYSDGKHSYIYLADNTLCRAVADENGAATVVKMARNVADVTLWKTVGNYLYYYGAGTNGNNLSRINYKGDANKDVYNPLLSKNEELKDYQPITIAMVDWSDSWYKPEFILGAGKDGTDVLLYPNAQSYGSGSTAYNYIYATQLGDVNAIEAQNEKYEAVNDYIDEYSSSTDTQNLIKFYFRTEGLKVSEESKALYDEELFAEVEGKFAAEGGELVKEKTLISLIGKMTADDVDEITEAWQDSLLSEEEEVEEEKGLETWAIVLIIVGSVLIVAVAVAVPVALYLKKKKQKAKEAEATVNAYKRKKIDTTDDKSIDVYADDDAPVAEENTEEKTDE